MKKVCFYIFLSLIFISCYDDKGNYDYVDIGKIDIEKFDWISVTMGDTVKIKPKFNMEIPEDASNIVYKWTLNGEERPDDPHWNSRDFYWVADKKVRNATIQLEITDTRNGMKYMQRTMCSVSGEFNAFMSWMILSDDNGRSVLSFFKTLDMEYSPDWTSVMITDSKFYADLYPFRNGGEELGRGPLHMQEHYHRYGSDPGNIWFFSESGTVDLEGEGLTKDIDLEQAFLGEIPSDVTIVGGVSMMQVDVLYDQKGRLYSRVKSNSELFHSDYFLPEPLRYQGEVLEQCEPILGRYTKYGAGYTPIIDRKNHRILAISDGRDAMLGSGEIIECPSEISEVYGYEIPEKYIPLNDFSGYEILSMQYMLPGSSSRDNYPGFIILFKDSFGNLFLQEFSLELEIDMEKGTYLKMARVKVYDMNLLGEVPSIVCTPPYPASTNYTFFAQGNVLYYFDRDAKKLEPYVEFESPITALDAESNLMNMLMGVGLENGRFYVLDITNAKNTPENKRVIASSPKEVNVGKIIQVRYKIGSGQSSWT